jgi:hypothetical protein
MWPCGMTRTMWPCGPPKRTVTVGRPIGRTGWQLNAIAVQLGFSVFRLNETL